MRDLMSKLLVVSTLTLLLVAASDAQTVPDGAGIEPAAGDYPDALPADAPPPADVPPPPITGTVTPTGTDGGTSVQAIREGEVEAVANYLLHLRDLEQRINQLKQEVFRSKARLIQLAETVLQGSGGGRSKIKILHRSEMSGTFQLVKLAYFVDRSPVYNQVDESGELGNLDEINVYESIIAPGDHTVSVEIEYRGYGHGIFSYLQGYRFRVNSSHTITVAGGKEVTVVGVGYEQGGPLTAIEERPTIRFAEQVRDLAISTEGR